MSSHAHHEHIEEEASLWAARLDGGGMTDADRAALGAWLDADPGHRDVLARYRQLSAQLDEQLGAAADSLVIHAAAVRRRRWRQATAIFAAAAAIAVFFLVLATRSEQLATKTGERHVAALGDGSRIELNAQTELAMSFGRAERRVRLTHGEALFHVAKDAARPFFVETPAGIVRVTGTVFNVRATPRAGDRVEVTVLEGRVRVRANDRAADDTPLTPGVQAVLAEGRVATHPLSESATQDAVAWRRGQAVFDDTPLRDALDRFSPYHARTLLVDPGVADLRIGGLYALDDLDGFLEAIAKFLPVTIVKDPDAVKIVAR